MKKVTFTVLAGLAVVAVLATGCKKDEPVVVPTPTPTPAPASLYTRLGGDAAITLVTDKFISYVVADEILVDNFVATGTTPGSDKFNLFRERLIDQLCEATGGPYTYLGETMLVAHTGMNVTEAEFNALAGHLSKALDDYSVPATEKNELLGAVGGMKADVVGH